MPTSLHVFRTALSAAVLVPLVAIPLSPAGAQAQWRFVPQVGLYAPLSDLPALEDAREVGDRESSLAYGLGIEMGNPDGFVGLRVGILHGTAQEVPVEGIGCTDCVRSTLTALTATLMVRPLRGVPIVTPYLLAGGGVKRLDFDRDEGVDAVFSDENAGTGHLGLGVGMDLGLIGLRAEISDLISTFDGNESDETQHDMFLTLGVVIGG